VQVLAHSPIYFVSPPTAVLFVFDGWRFSLERGEKDHARRQHVVAAVERGDAGRLDAVGLRTTIDRRRITTSSMPNLIPANNPVEAGFLGDYM
jgi:hypothetical protein